MFTAFDTLCRRSELVQFDWDDLVPDFKDGSAILKLGNSKTDQNCTGTELYVSYYHEAARLLEKRQHQSRQELRGIYSDGTMADSLSAKGVERCFKRIAARLDFPSHLLT